MSEPIIFPETPERGGCPGEPAIVKEPVVVPEEAPVPIVLPGAPVPAPNWPVKVPAKVLLS